VSTKAVVELESVHAFALEHHHIVMPRYAALRRAGGAGNGDLPASSSSSSLAALSAAQLQLGRELKTSAETQAIRSLANLDPTPPPAAASTVRATASNSAPPDKSSSKPPQEESVAASAAAEELGALIAGSACEVALPTHSSRNKFPFPLALC
jgi:hypothetical protein